MIRRSAHVRRLKPRTIRVAATSRRRGYSFRRPGSSVVVRSSLVQNLGLPGKGPAIIPVRPSGSLTRFGYHVASATPSRRAALARILASGRNRLKLFHQLNAVGKLTSRTDENYSKKYFSNRNWVMHH